MINDLEEFKTYNRAMELGEVVWDMVIKWNYFEKDTIGKGCGLDCRKSFRRLGPVSL
jgi:hypothetical protein